MMNGLQNALFNKEKWNKTQYAEAFRKDTFIYYLWKESPLSVKFSTMGESSEQRKRMIPVPVNQHKLDIFVRLINTES